MLNITIIKKKYSQNVVLQNATMNIPKAGIYGLVGKNGQGKTTLFKCILGLENYEGSCTFQDKKIDLRNVGWCPAEPMIYDELTAMEFVQFYKDLLNIKEKFTTNLFDVPNDRLIKEFSTGMKKKAYLNAVFQTNYEIYILDEPFNGLDLEANHQLMHYLTQKAKTSVVIISSHIMDILYNNCEQIFIVQNKGVAKFEKSNFDTIENTLFGN